MAARHLRVTRMVSANPAERELPPLLLPPSLAVEGTTPVEKSDEAHGVNSARIVVFANGRWR